MSTSQSRATLPLSASSRRHSEGTLNIPPPPPTQSHLPQQPIPNLASKAAPPCTIPEWTEITRSLPLTKENLDSLVLNYLVTEGFREAAELFVAAQPSLTTASNTDWRLMENITERQRAKSAILRGDIDGAMRIVNDYDPNLILDNRPLFFHLLQQKMIELIRAGRRREAISLGQLELAPLGRDDEDWIKELEDTLLLLIFDQPSSNTTSAPLLSQEQRIKLAEEVNAAMLACLDHIQETRLITLLKAMDWLQSTVLGPTNPKLIPSNDGCIFSFEQ